MPDVTPAVVPAVKQTRTPSLTTERARQLCEELVSNGIAYLNKDSKAAITVVKAAHTKIIPATATAPETSEIVDSVDYEYTLHDLCGITATMAEIADAKLDPIGENRKRVTSLMNALKEAGLTPAQIKQLVNASL